MGVRDLTHGFMGGLKGIFVDPIRGAQEEGVTGLVKGARKGIISFFQSSGGVRKV